MRQRNGKARSRKAPLVFNQAFSLQSRTPQVDIDFHGFHASVPRGTQWVCMDGDGKVYAFGCDAQRDFNNNVWVTMELRGFVEHLGTIPVNVRNIPWYNAYVILDPETKANVEAFGMGDINE